ncbi:MAG: hypothetical protein ACRDA4_04215 [Filifactoraceae bacterium]
MKEFKCQICPRSCQLKVDDQGYTIKVRGNRCTRGFAFAESKAYSLNKDSGKVSIIPWMILGLLVFVGILCYFIKF